MQRAIHREFEKVHLHKAIEQRSRSCDRHIGQPGRVHSYATSVKRRLSMSFIPHQRGFGFGYGYGYKDKDGLKDGKESCINEEFQQSVGSTSTISVTTDLVPYSDLQRSRLSAISLVASFSN